MSQLYRLLSKYTDPLERLTIMFALHKLVVDAYYGDSSETTTV